MDLDINLSTHTIPGVAEAETDALYEAEAAYNDVVTANRAYLADDWQDQAHAREVALTAAEIADKGKRDAKRMPELHTASIRRAEVLAELGTLKAEVNRLDVIARDAIAAQVAEHVAPTAQAAYEALAAYATAIAALEDTAREAKHAIAHAINVRHRANGGSPWQDPGSSAGDHAFSGRETRAVYEAREALTQAQSVARRHLGGTDNG